MKIVRTFPNSVLLEDENCFRFFVNNKIFKSGDEERIREYGVPYSLPFDLLIEDEDSERIQIGLYRSGIHKLEDILNNRKIVRKIIGDKLSVEELIEKIKGESNG